MHIKICGITNSEDALHAVAEGASHIGLIFVENTPRYLDVEKAKAIADAIGNKATVVGVFQNHSQDAIESVVKAADIGAIQLHGQEDADFCRSLRDKLGLPVIKTIVMDNLENFQAENAALVEALMQKIEPYTSETVDYLLFDKPKGSKQSAQDWITAAATQLWLADNMWRLGSGHKMPPFLFAGSLTAESLPLAFVMIRAAGYDVASGVEAAPGKKDPALVSAFINTILEFKRAGAAAIKTQPQTKETTQ